MSRPRSNQTSSLARPLCLNRKPHGSVCDALLADSLLSSTVMRNVCFEKKPANQPADGESFQQTHYANTLLNLLGPLPFKLDMRTTKFSYKFKDKLTHIHTVLFQGSISLPASVIYASVLSIAVCVCVTEGNWAFINQCTCDWVLQCLSCRD